MPSFAYKRRFVMLTGGRSRSHWTATGLLLFAAVLLIAAMILLGLNLQSFRESFGWVQHTNNVLLNISRMETNLSRVESATRGYVIGGRQIFLLRAQADEKDLLAGIAELQTLLRDNPAQVKTLKELKAAIDRRLSVVHSVAQAGPDNPEKAGEILRDPRFRDQLFDLRDVLVELRGREGRYLLERQSNADRTATLYFMLAIGTTIVATLLVGFGVGLLQWERNRLRIRELQSRLYHVQRLSAVEATASALAHEINQPLAAASNYVGALKNMMSSSPEKVEKDWSDIVANVGRQIERATGIISRLRNFVSGQEMERNFESPGAIVDDAVALLGTLDTSLQMDVHIAPYLPDIFVDRIQIQQVLVNLMRNAIEAMGDMPSPKLILEAKLAGSNQVEMILTDNGPGLPPRVREQLFQPFVTTKESGMGVGLSICRSIIEHHDGRIWVEALSSGTAFHFTLPAARARAAA